MCITIEMWFRQVVYYEVLYCVALMSAYFCPHSMINFGYLIEFVCLKSDLIDSYDN